MNLYILCNNKNILAHRYENDIKVQLKHFAEPRKDKKKTSKNT